MPKITKSAPCSFEIQRARAEDCESAWQIVEEYYEAAHVIARDTKDDFARVYFQDGAGVWLATVDKDVVGCIALRPLVSITCSGEVKRLYVQPQHRGRGIAAALYEALELGARQHGYDFLYLDTTDEMVAAQRFYAALGYGPSPRYNDNPQATIFMKKDLRQSSW